MRDAGFDATVRTFFDEQPRWLMKDVQFIRLAGEDEPAISLSMEAMRAFVAWAMAKGIVRRPERVPEFLALLDRLDHER